MTCRLSGDTIWIGSDSATQMLLSYHIGMLFNPWEWHIKNGETSENFKYWMVGFIVGKFWSVATLTLMTCVLLYFLLIRPLK